MGKCSAGSAQILSAKTFAHAPFANLVRIETCQFCGFTFAHNDFEFKNLAQIRAIV
jgi:hypothetical protein